MSSGEGGGGVGGGTDGRVVKSSNGDAKQTHAEASLLVEKEMKY